MQTVHVMTGLLLFFDLRLCSQETGCEQGWFGSQCQYKCRCTHNYCDKEGRCKSGDRCDKGWFGPACQYVDEAFGTSTLREVTDGDDDTCVSDPATRRIAISVVLMFTWLRVHFSTDGFLDRIQMRIRHNASAIVCPSSRNVTVDTKTIDIHCPIEDAIQGVIIFGPGAQYICSVYVSGGRNVALKQKAEQSSTHTEVSTLTGFQNWSFPADLAVDGNRDQSFYTGRSCAQTARTHPPLGVVCVILSRPFLISQVIIYNRQNGFASNLLGFLLESFNEAGHVIHSHKNNLPIPLSLYKVLIPTLFVARVRIYAFSRDNVLNICELEIYGDSICEIGSYGKECEKVCNCFDDETCFVGTGGCASGCAVGYWGEDCSKICDPGKYGRDCQETCSQFCFNDSKVERLCDHVSGECLHGCQLGYQPPTCASVCNPGKYGADCEQACNKQCEKPNTYPTRECSAINGTCLHGCASGYHGASCTLSCSRNTYGKNCQKSCSRGCLPSNTSRYISCNHQTGECLNGCDEGYNGTSCDTRLTQLAAVFHLPLGITKTGLVAIVTAAVVAGLLSLLLALFLCVRKRYHDNLEEGAE